MQNYSDDSVRILAAASARRSSIQNDWRQGQKDLQAIWPHKGHTVIALVHEGDQGLNAEDATDVLGVLQRLKPNDPVDIILHMPGGSAIAANRIAAALVGRPNTAAFVPFFAGSAGTEVALATQHIFLGKDANLSLIDVSVEGSPAREIVALAKQAGSKASEGLKLAAKVAERALREKVDTIDKLINRRHKKSGILLAKRMTGGKAAQGQPINYAKARRLGLAVTNGVPAELFGFIGKRRAYLRQLKEIDARIRFVHGREPERPPSSGAAVG